MPPLKAERRNNTLFDMTTVNVLAVQSLATGSEGDASCGWCFYFLTILATCISPDTGPRLLGFRPVVSLPAEIDLGFFLFLPRVALTVVFEPIAVSIFKTHNSRHIL